MEIEVFDVVQITEPDFGCEDSGREKRSVLLKLIPEGSREDATYVEMTEEDLDRRGISAGKKVVIAANGDYLKYVRVVAAVIREVQDGKTRIFATARGYGDYKGWWEFPGGKIEPGETPQAALAREIREELTAEIEVGDLIRTIEYDYPEFHLSMDCFWAKVKNGALVLKEAEAACWLTREELDTVDWLPADRELLAAIASGMENSEDREHNRQTDLENAADTTENTENMTSGVSGRERGLGNSPSEKAVQTGSKMGGKTVSSIVLLHASAVEQHADAIVNAANRHLVAGGGICGAIFQAAGYSKLTAACSAIKTPLWDGEAVITPAFAMRNTKAIIHAVGPDFGRRPKAFKELFNAYYNSLVVLKDNGLHSISFPLISSGIFGGSLDNPTAESTKQCCLAYRRFTEDFPEYLVDVMLCAYGEREYQKAKEEFDIHFPQ